MLPTPFVTYRGSQVEGCTERISKRYSQVLRVAEVLESLPHAITASA